MASRSASLISLRLLRPISTCRGLAASSRKHQSVIFNSSINVYKIGVVCCRGYSKRQPDVRSEDTSSPGAKWDVSQLQSENLKDLQKRANPDHLKHFKTTTGSTVSPAPTADKYDDVLNTERGALFRSTPEPPIGEHTLPHPIWSEAEVHNVKITHKPPEGLVENMAFAAVRVLRGVFDVLSGYNRKERNTDVWLNRICFLETVAGVPGMVAAMTRHLHSLRLMRRDHGWIHTLLEEAENERMHLMTALQLKQPSWLFRTAVVGAQGMFVITFSVAYLLSPRFCHRFVGYLEEEAVVTYTKLLKDIEDGHMQHWKTMPAPDVAVRYWQLAEGATMKDVILAIRADEAHHRVVNHTLGSLRTEDYNPYKPGE